jgi:hypothetical protein
MSKQQLTAGGYLDILTKDELKEALGHDFSHDIRELYRGIDYLTFVGNAGLVGANSVTLPWMPDSGYCWSVKIASVQISTSSPFSVHIGSDNSQAAVFTGSSGLGNQCVGTWTSNNLVVKDGQGITFAFSGNTNIGAIRLHVKQVPTVMQGKL